MSVLPVGEPTIAGAAWRYRVVVTIALVLALAAALGYALSRPVQYTATAGLVLEDPRTAPVFGSPLNAQPDRYVSDQISVLKSSEVDRAASDAAARQRPPLQLSADYFSTHATVSGSQRDGNFVQVSVIAADSGTALGGVDALVTGYEGVVHTALNAQVSSVLAQIDAANTSIDGELAVVQTQLAAAAKSGASQQQLLAQQQALLARRATLADKRDQVTVDASRQSTGVSIYLKAQQATRSSRLTSALPVLALAGAGGLLLGVGCAYALAWRRRVFSRSDDPEEVVGAPLIAKVPRLPSAAAVGVFHTAALVVRALRPQGGSQVIAITSAQRQRGRSTIAGHLAFSLAADGLRVLLIDADGGHRGLGDVLAGRFGAGLVDDAALRERAPAGAALARVSMEGGMAGELILLRPLRHHPAPLSAAAVEGYSRIRADADVVLIDAPPAGELGPCLELVGPAQVVLVVAHDEAIASVQEAARVLQVIGLSVVGYIYNQLPSRRSWRRRRPLRGARRAVPGRAARALPATTHTSSAGTT